jgi:hypothetical protein
MMLMGTSGGGNGLEGKLFEGDGDGDPDADADADGPPPLRWAWSDLGPASPQLTRGDAAAAVHGAVHVHGAAGALFRGGSATWADGGGGHGAVGTMSLAPPPVHPHHHSPVHPEEEVELATACCVCEAARASAAFAPCGHVAACDGCAAALARAAAAQGTHLRCPACGRAVAGVRPGVF